MLKKTLSATHKDFICQKLAQFIPHRDIASIMRERYPELDLDEKELVIRIKYYASNRKAAKWRKRVEMYRNILNSNLRNRFALANRFERLRQLEKIVSEALKPQLCRMYWYPDGRDENGRLNYDHEKILKTDPATAIKAIAMINRELEALGKNGLAAIPLSPEIENASTETILKNYEEKMKYYSKLETSEIELET